VLKNLFSEDKRKLQAYYQQHKTIEPEKFRYIISEKKDSQSKRPRPYGKKTDSTIQDEIRQVTDDMSRHRCAGLELFKALSSAIITVLILDIRHLLSEVIVAYWSDVLCTGTDAEIQGLSRITITARRLRALSGQLRRRTVPEHRSGADSAEAAGLRQRRDRHSRHSARDADTKDQHHHRDTVSSSRRTRTSSKTTSSRRKGTS
jgi:hypothetical protein